MPSWYVIYVTLYGIISIECPSWRVAEAVLRNVKPDNFEVIRRGETLLSSS
jgi:hypothetical protein